MFSEKMKFYFDRVIDLVFSIILLDDTSIGPQAVGEQRSQMHPAAAEMHQLLIRSV